MGLFKKKKTEAAQPAATNEAGPPVPALPPVELKAVALSGAEAQGVEIACRQLPGMPIASGVLAHGLSGRAEKIMMDFAPNGVAVRFRVDGVWENGQPMDRQTGDAGLVVLKRMAGLDAADRKSRQSGRIGGKFVGNDWFFDVVSQGVKNGERVQITLVPKKPVFTQLGDLGMREKMQEQLREQLGKPNGMVLVSAPPSHGLDTSWLCVLEAADKFVRDYHQILAADQFEPEVINVTDHRVDVANGESAVGLLKKLLLKQPDAFVVSNMFDEEFCGILINQLLNEGRQAIVRHQANDAAEALLTFAAKYRAHANEIIKATHAVLNQRLVRRLCLSCRQSFTPQPQLLQKLRIPPGRIQVLYQPYVPPPPEQRVDEKGNPIEIPICQQCNGRGYLGRIAIFELLIITDEIREQVLANPDVNNLRKIAAQNGHRPIQDEGVLTACLGLTSLQELQRMMQSK